MTFRLRKDETEIDLCVNEKRTPAVFMKCEGNLMKMLTCASGGRYK